jgi:hypothetical protein
MINRPAQGEQMGLLESSRSKGCTASHESNGAPKKLDAKQIMWIYDTVAMKNPLQVKLPFAP